MSRRILSRILVTLFTLMCVSINAGAQAYGSYTPYSIFGLGDLSQTGTAYNKSMGGVGIASRNNRFINILNPASVSARDSLSFMVDFSLYSDNKIFRQADMKSASNTFNINDCVISFPIYRSSAMMLGVMPYSDSGFQYSYSYDDPTVIGNAGNVGYSAFGDGSVYKGFAAAGVTFWRRLSLGVEADYYFGSLSKYYYTTFSDNSHSNLHNETKLQINGLGLKVGMQYEQPIFNKFTLGAGATFSTGSSLKGYLQKSSFLVGSAASDTLSFRCDTLGSNIKSHIPSEFGVGVSLRYADKLRLEFDYTRSDWKNSNILQVSDFANDRNSPFSASVSEAFRFGFEFIPNRNDIRYYLNRVAYRGGVYYKKEYYTLYGQVVSSKGITLGATLPIYRLSNGLTLGVDFGQRGSIEGNLIRERYVNFSIGVNLYDIWFQKSMYE